MSVRHAKHTALPDIPGYEILFSDWNADHVGDVLTADEKAALDAAPTALTALNPVASMADLPGVPPAPGATVTGPDAFGASAVVGASAEYSRADHDHGLPAAPAVPSGATPALTLGTANAAGSAATFVKTDATLLAFDAAAPSTQAFGDAASVGAATVAARRDHKHAMMAAPPAERAASTTTPAAIGTAAVGTGTTDARADHVHATGAGTPSTQAFGDAAAIGTGLAAAMTDHKHGMPAAQNLAAVLAVGAGANGIKLSGGTAPLLFIGGDIDSGQDAEFRGALSSGGGQPALFDLNAAVGATHGRAYVQTGGSAGAAGEFLGSDGADTVLWSTPSAKGSAGGDLAGTYPNPTIAAGAIASLLAMGARFWFRKYAIATGPVGYWRHGEPSGTTGIDQMGAHNGAYIGSPTLGVAGLLLGDPATAATFTGSSQFMQIATATALHPVAALSIAAMVSRTLGGEVNIWASGNNDAQLEFYSDNKLYFSKKGAVDLFMSTATISAGLHFVVLTWDGTTPIIYLDGVSIAGTVTAGTLVASTTAIKVGSPVGAGVGIQQETLLWGRVVTPAEVAVLTQIALGT